MNIIEYIHIRIYPSQKKYRFLDQIYRFFMPNKSPPCSSGSISSSACAERCQGNTWHLEADHVLSFRLVVIASARWSTCMILILYKMLWFPVARNSILLICLYSNNVPNQNEKTAPPGPAPTAAVSGLGLKWGLNRRVLRTFEQWK